uniref:Putative secreted protein n=1 Tax=Anopheles darlingi TaxID=43151 RepID=A0A2M4DFV6_ANODA
MLLLLLLLLHLFLLLLDLYFWRKWPRRFEGLLLPSFRFVSRSSLPSRSSSNGMEKPTIERASERFEVMEIAIGRTFHRCFRGSLLFGYER